jgi:hypothetical protein
VDFSDYSGRSGCAQSRSLPPAFGDHQYQALDIGKLVRIDRHGKLADGI